MYCSGTDFSLTERKLSLEEVLDDARANLSVFIKLSEKSISSRLRLLLLLFIVLLSMENGMDIYMTIYKR